MASSLPHIPLAPGGVLTLVSDAMLVAAAILLLALIVGAIAATRPATKARMTGGYERAFALIERAIDAWHAEGRLTDDEAARLRVELREPEFTAVLPHLGVHLAIGVALRFPIGSITRATYVLSNMALAHLRFATRRITAATLRRNMGIHSPLVLALTCMPGIGTFAYLASRPCRAHHLLVRVALDAALTRLPRDIYGRAGLRAVIVRQVAATDALAPALRLRFVPARMLWLLGLVVCGLFALDVGTLIVDETLEPTFLGWEPVARLLDLNSESSIGTWMSVMLLALCAGLLGLIARARHAARDRFRWHWTLLALLALGLSIDEGAKVHDLGSGFGAEMRERLNLGGALYYGWVIVAFVTIVILAIAYRRFVIALPRETRTWLMIAAGVYVAGELGMEMAGGWVMDRQGQTFPYLLLTSFEEFLAMAGVLIAIGALLTLARTAVGPVLVEVAGAGTQPRHPAPGAATVPELVVALDRDGARVEAG
jgi:hypothetical protein